MNFIYIPYEKIRKTIKIFGNSKKKMLLCPHHSIVYNTKNMTFLSYRRYEIK